MISRTAWDREERPTMDDVRRHVGPIGIVLGLLVSVVVIEGVLIWTLWQKVMG